MRPSSDFPGGAVVGPYFWASLASLFALATLDLFGVVSQPKTALGLIFPVLTWLVGLGAVVLLWRRDSTEFFKPQRLV